MRIFMIWLCDYLKLDILVDELVEKIEWMVVEVDGVICFSEGLKKVVVGYVLMCELYLDFDYFYVC